MVQFDNQYRQIKIKVVYYGPALGGKTSCLQHIHKATDPNRRTKLYSMNTASDRTLFFDLLSLNLGRIRGYQLAIQLYTVPGQVQYDATRRAVLSGADGIVFVADSQEHCRETNKQSLENLWINLVANGLDRSSMPLVLHYNKRDLDPLISTEDMNEALNPKKLPAIPSIATTGQGVMEGFATVSELTLAAVADKLGVGSNPAAVERLQKQVRASLEGFMGEDVPQDVSVVVPSGVESTDEPLDKDILVGEAVKANMAMTDLNARLDTMSRLLNRKISIIAGIQKFGSEVSAEHDPLNVLRMLLSAAINLLEVPAAAVMMVPGSGEMKEVAVHGIGRDPLLHTPDEVGEAFAIGLVGAAEPRLLNSEIEDPGLLFSTIEAAGFSSAVIIPLVAGERIQGLLTVYADSGRDMLEEEDLQLASVLGSTAAIACSNARSWQQLEATNRDLESQVEARTRDLKSSLTDVQRLARDLEDKNRIIDDAYRELAELDHIKDELISRLAQDLKTPISSVAGASKILEGYREMLPEKGMRFISIIRDETAKLSELIQSIFQASVLASSKTVPVKALARLDELIKRGFMPLRDLAQAKKVRLKVLIPSGLESIDCDAGSMEIALRAVFKNAIVFNRDAGEVTIAVRRIVRGGEAWISITVTDTGIGIASADVPRIFDTFWQGDNAPADRPHGIGLGLAIAKRVVTNHGGEIIASSSPQGTEVAIALPQ